MMQQTVLMTAVRGPDGMPKYGSIKMLLRWFRRCILLSAIDGRVLENPVDTNGGSFTGPSFEFFHNADLNWEGAMDEIVGGYLTDIDAIPHHFQLHLIHAVEIVGYKHPDRRIREWWNKIYLRLVHDMHLFPESKEALDRRLGDTRAGWLERADPATAK
jgi:hypothetical protein